LVGKLIISQTTQNLY